MQLDCTAADTDSGCTQHKPRDCSFQAVAAVEVEVVVCSFAGCMPAAEATQRMILQKSCCAATGILPDTHIRSSVAVLRRLPRLGIDCCTSPDPCTQIAAAALPVQRVVAVHIARSVLAGCMDPDTRVAAVAGTGHSGSTTCLKEGNPWAVGGGLAVAQD